MHQPSLQIITYASRALKTVISHCYTSFHLSADLYNYIEDVDCISNLFDNWENLPKNF